MFPLCLISHYPFFLICSFLSFSSTTHPVALPVSGICSWKETSLISIMSIMSPNLLGVIFFSWFVERWQCHTGKTLYYWNNCFSSFLNSFFYWQLSFQRNWIWNKLIVCSHPSLFEAAVDVLYCDDRHAGREDNGPVIEFNGRMRQTCAHESMSHCFAIRVMSMVRRVSKLARLIEHHLPRYKFLITVNYIRLYVRYTSC